MRKLGYFTTATAAAMLLTQPCAAADDFGESTRLALRNGSFAGATFRLPLGRADRAVQSPHFSLAISRLHQQVGSAGSLHNLATPGVELRFSSASEPLFLLGGQKPSTIKQKLGVGPVGAVLAIGGLAAAAVAVGGMSSADKAEREELDRPQCFLPEKELCR